MGAEEANDKNKISEGRVEIAEGRRLRKVEDNKPQASTALIILRIHQDTQH